METGLSCLERYPSPIGTSETTGISVFGSFLASSGFNYQVGIREIKGLLIVEQIAEGTACTYLCGILLYHKESRQLIRDIPIEEGMRYSRMTTMKIVRDELLDFLLEASKKQQVELDILQAKEFIDSLLDDCYFERSRKAAIDWARSVGIIN